jgi:hypothetical protein
MIFHFILAVIGFFLFCSLIANFILVPHKKYPTMNGIFGADTLHFWSRLF